MYNRLCIPRSPGARLRPASRPRFPSFPAVFAATGTVGRAFGVTGGIPLAFIVFFKPFFFVRSPRTAALAILCALCLGIGLFMEPIAKWGTWMDLVSIYIIPIGATLGAVSWFYVMKKDELLSAINTGAGRERGAVWYAVGRYVYVPLAVILCCVSLFRHVAF